MNKSKQREAILEVLRSTTSHPTAEWVYEKTREIIPNISLGTVYRNLAQLEKNAEIIKVPGIFEKDRYDGNPVRHTHFICKSCRAVIDVEIKADMSVLLEPIEGMEVHDYSIVLSGICDKCLATDVKHDSKIK